MIRDCLRHWWAGTDPRLEFCKRCKLVRLK